MLVTLTRNGDLSNFGEVPGDPIGGGLVTRADVSFSSGGVDCAAWLYRPAGEGLCPMVVMAHGFSATRELRLDAYAERFCDAGLGALVFDYRHFGASAGEPRQLLDIKKQQDDYRAAVGYARALDWVDSTRVALFGTSFSGGHVLAVAAADQQIAAVVSQCPFTDGLASLPKLGPANIARATVAGLRDQLAALVGRPAHYIPAVGPPGSFAVMTTPDAQPGFQALVPPESRWENRVAARVALRVASYRPGRAAAKIACPVLFCVCDGDAVAPAKETLKYAEAAPRGEIKRYPVGHFDIYVGEAWEHAIADQTEFLSRWLGGGHGSAGLGEAVARA
jgi:pimeloyl-ACP methyl ester carboxylesterase